MPAVSSVMVTGATGFIGRHCLPLLRQAGYRVHAVSSRAAGEEAGGVHWIQCDLLDRDSLRRLMAEVRPSHLLHLAWCTDHDNYWWSDQNIRWLQSSLELLCAFREAGGKRVVMTGSCAEYKFECGYCVEDNAVTEPATLYGAAKNALGKTLQAYTAARELSSAWARMFFLYGPYENPARLVPSMVNALLSGSVAECTHGRQVRDYLHVEDAAAALTTLLDSDLCGPVNIGSGRPVLVRELIHAIGDITGRGDLIRLGARPAPESEPPVVLADTRRLRRELGWAPGICLRDGMERTVAWWRARAAC